jgi:Lar family restriction alleviation protein
MTDALKSCPFCGGKPGFTQMGDDHGNDNAYNFVICADCGATCANIDTRPEADCVAAWNRRAAAAPPVGWVLVPVEPTPQMLAAAEKDLDRHAWTRLDERMWHALLAAAPDTQ